MSAKISLCMIVRDEEANLEACLESVKDYVDEIVIVDTGSVDATKAIAARYADILVDYQWTGDFSAARNYSMDLATGNVILIMDADERLIDGGEDLRRLANRERFLCGYIHLINRVDQGPFTGDKVLHPRLFRSDPSMRYRFAVHNQIEDSVRQFMQDNPGTWVVDAAQTHFLHLGYDLAPDEARAKYTPRIDKLKACIGEARDDEEKAYYQFQAGLMIASAQSAAESAAYWHAIDYEKLNKENRWFAHFTASRVFLQLGDITPALLHCNAMIQVNPEPAALMMTGVCLIEDGRRDDGLKLYIQAFLNNLMPHPAQRCQLDGQRMLDDLRKMLTDEENAQITGTDSKSIVESVRAFQRSFVSDELIEGLCNV